jgi:hypothetical protein
VNVYPGFSALCQVSCILCGVELILYWHTEMVLMSFHDVSVSYKSLSAVLILLVIASDADEDWLFIGSY